MPAARRRRAAVSRAGRADDAIADFTTSLALKPERRRPLQPRHGADGRAPSRRSATEYRGACGSIRSTRTPTTTSATSPGARKFDRGRSANSRGRPPAAAARRISKSRRRVCGRQSIRAGGRSVDAALRLNPDEPFASEIRRQRSLQSVCASAARATCPGCSVILSGG